jgi:hypothetical protein
MVFFFPTSNRLRFVGMLQEKLNRMNRLTAREEEKIVYFWKNQIFSSFKIVSWKED